MLGATARPAAAMFAALTSTQAQMAALRAATDSLVQPREMEMFEIVVSFVGSALKERNRVAHWLWAHSPELPDAILLVDPAESLERQVALTEVFHELADVPPVPGRLGYDRTKIMVYREHDLLGIVDRLERAQWFSDLFRNLANPQNLQPDRIYALLAAEPEIATALARLRERQKTQTSIRSRKRGKDRQG